MDILLFLIPVTFILALTGLITFMWSVKNKQYDDLEGAANRILFEDDFENQNKEIIKHESENKNIN